MLSYIKLHLRKVHAQQTLGREGTEDKLRKREGGSGRGGMGVGGVDSVVMVCVLTLGGEGVNVHCTIFL